MKEKQPTIEISLNNFKGALLNEDRVRLLDEPFFNEESQRWNALADVDGMLCVIELKLIEVK